MNDVGIAVTVTVGAMKPILENLAKHMVGDKYKRIKGLRKKVAFLTKELSDMNDLLKKMDTADKLDPQAKSWRKDILDMSYDIEDCIEIFMDSVGETEPGDNLGILHKTLGYLRTSKYRYHIGKQINEIMTRVIQTGQRRDRYRFDVNYSGTLSVVVDPRMPVINMDYSATLVGIDTQKEELIKLLMDEEQQLKVVSIVGFGGSGKTTLATKVYQEVGVQFNCKAFVSISQKPDVTRLLNSILAQLGLRPNPHVSDMDLINQIRQHLQDKRYFIILDDLWDIEPWKTITCAFAQNNKYSRLMITTQNEHVARTYSGNHQCIHNMQPLSEQNSRKLFLNRIFGSEDDCPPQFIEASYEILKKCAGLPLAIITVASILACQPTMEQWEKLRNSLANRFAENFAWEDMMSILNLSYISLPYHLKACFLYLGTYPEDHKISKVDLVRQWVAERFVDTSDDRQDKWDIAEKYFNELVNRSMIQPVYDEYNIEVSHFKVHDMILDLISLRCKEDNFVSSVHDSRAIAEPSKCKVRRLSVSLRGLENGTIPVAFSNGLSHVRSISMFGPSGWIPTLVDFKFLRVLFMESIWMDTSIDLTGICELSLLRYLKVSGTLVMLPSQIHRLQHLETLELPLLQSHVPLDIVELPHLSYLTLPEGTALPEGIGKVKSLRTLNWLCLLKSSSESIEGLGELTNLVELRICNSDCLPKTPRWIVALNSSLGKLSNLKVLSMYSFDAHFCADALSSWVSPPFSNLEELNLQAWTFSRVPRWVESLCKLRELGLGVKKILQEDVDMIGTRLPSLVLLRLRIPDFQTDRVVIAGSTGFRLLKFFGLDCDGMSWLTFEAGAMPKLSLLGLALDPDRWDVAAPAGLQHLCNLQEISVVMTGRSEEEQSRIALVKSVFQEAVDAHPNLPTLDYEEGWERDPELREDGTCVDNENEEENICEAEDISEEDDF
ncbi:hypothetical protein ACP4OV_018490 [Aristida adscensionis]